MLRAILVGGAIEGEPGARNPAYFASWKIIPMVWRIPERTRLTPCRRLTRYAPFVPFTGLLCTANATASPCRNGTTSTRLCTRGRCSVRTNSPTGEILLLQEIGVLRRIAPIDIHAGVPLVGNHGKVRV